MGERRKRKSLWDKEAETKPFPGTSENNNWIGKDHQPSQDRERYHEFSASGSHRAPKFRDHSGQPSLDSIEKDPVAQMNGGFIKSRENGLEGKEIGGENSYYQNMSPEFKYNHSLENDRSHSRRYPGRGRSRSRSRSRSRTRGRGRSRSLSRGRELERVRGRSRSRSEADGRGRAGSRSPSGDQKHQSSGLSDRRNLPEKSTEICSDFSAGRCRRGSQCKYFHPKNTTHKAGGLGGADTSESWRSRADQTNNSKQSYSRGPRTELRGDVSDPYHGEGEQFQNKSKNAIPCKNFIKGKCRWGDTCRFSHHAASDETSVEGTKHTTSDKDTEHQPYRNRNLLCNYFAAGKCDRDNCRFSHEDSKFNSLEGRQGKVIDDHGSRDKRNKRNGPTWDDAGRISDDMKPSVRNNSDVTVTDNTVDNSNAGHNNRWSHSLGNENINWVQPQKTDNLVDNNNEPVCRAGSGSYGGDIGTTESVSEGNMTAKQEVLVFLGSQLQNQDGNMNVQGQNKLQADQRFCANTWPQNVSPVSHIQQKNHNLASSFHSDVLGEVKDLRNATDPVLLSGQNLHQNGETVLPGHSFISEEAGSEQTSALNGAEMHQVTNLHLQSLIQKHQHAIQMTGMSEMNASQSFPNLVTSEHSAQYTNAPLSALQQVAPVTNPVMFPNQRFENEHSGKNAVMEVSNSTGTSNTQFYPVSVSHDPLNPMDNGRSSNEHGNHREIGNKMPAGRLSPSSIVGMGPNNSEVDHSGGSKLQQERAPEDPEFDEVKRDIAEQSKGVQNSMLSETLDGHGKAEESIANKEMRLFKNSLIEFVKEILKPTWKEGRMSREVHKTIVKKVVDKITSTIQTEHIPKTQDKVEQYLSFSKPKIAKLVQAYVERCLRTDS
ncbi:zinc finger CCCH domain protein [Perilla frutescens var. frutescens]|nr:zinc finger CCCH domain protein [Perilla frutescens var. frutescens]